jgi:mannitol-1-/sugar-/sorbitol-6-phosphatase
MESVETSSPVRLQCKGILFDMDGILISSIGSVERSWTKWALQRGIDPAYAISIAHGCRSVETVALLRPDLDPDAETAIIENYEIADKDDLAVLPGVLKLLASLSEDLWTVVTSATEPLARARLGAAGIPLPQKMVTAESVQNGKPHPDPYLAGAALLGLRPEECVVFEDAASGANAGHAAGCTVIATTFSHSAESLAAADYLIADLTGLVVSIQPDGSIGLNFTPLLR